MTDQLHPKLGQLNRLFKEIQQYKADHPSEKVGYYTNNVGSVLNAYREGDLNWEEAIEAVKVACSPQVAPGLLRDLRTLTEKIYDALRDDPLINQNIFDIQRASEVAANIAAAQGGRVVDREKLREYLESHVESFTNTLAEAQAKNNGSDHSIRKIARLQACNSELSLLLSYIDRGDFSAVPSAPGGSERIREAWESLKVAIFDGRGWSDKIMPMQEAVDALGTPQGSDSLTYSTELPTVEGWYWRRYPDSRTVDCVWYGLRRSHHTKMTFRTVSGPVDNMEGFEFAGPITEPAQPVAAGEAKERGEDE